ncbi:peptide deformylase [Candidatus Zixiibacteriota bacterium]
MAQIPIRIYGDPVLRKKASPVEGVDEELRTLAADMVETMQAADGIGLAANQVGELCRLLTLNFDIDEGGEGATALVNPRIVEREGEQISMEGCLSIPDIWEEVGRHDRIVVEYLDLAGEAQSRELSGLHSAVVQHEIDHLEGILFIDHLPSVRRMMLRGSLKQMTRSGRQTA